MWTTVKLGEVCSIISGNSIAAKRKSELFTGVPGVPYVATKDVSFDGKINFKNGVTIPEEYVGSFKLSPALSTLVCAEGGSAGRKVAFAERDCCFVNKLFSIKPSDLFEKKYIFYYVLSEEFQSQFKAGLHGLIGGVSLKKIKNFKITFPPVEEQQRIVARLDEAFEEIDRAHEASTEKLQQLDALELCCVNATFSRFEVSLEQVELQELCTKITDGVHKKPDYVESGVPFLKINNLTAGAGISFENASFISREAHEQFIKRTKPQKGDILITKDGTIGVVRKIDTDIEFSIFVSLALIKPKDMRHSDYLTHVLRSAYCQNQLNPSGTALKHIYLKDLRKLLIPVASGAVNALIVHELDTLEAIFQKLRCSYAKKTQCFKALKSAILAQELQLSETA